MRGIRQKSRVGNGYNGPMKHPTHMLRVRFVLKGLGGFLLGAILCRVRVGSSCAPLGLAFLAAGDICGISPLFTGAGVLLGAFLSGAPLWGVMISAALYVLTTRLMLAFLEDVTPTARGLVLVLSELAALPFEVAGGWPSAAMAVLSLILSLAAAVLFYVSLGLLPHLSGVYPLTDREQLLLFAVVGLVLMGLGDVALPGFSLPGLVLVVLVLVLMDVRGAFGLGPAVIMSALVSLRVEEGALLPGVMALSALAAALGAGYNRGYAAGGFFLCLGLLALVLRRPDLPPGLISAALGCGVYGLLPKDFFRRAANRMDSRSLALQNSRRSLMRLREHTAKEVDQAARLCMQLSALFIEEPAEHPFARTWPLGAAQRICDGCESRALCQRDEAAFQKTLLTLLRAYDRGDPVRPLSPMDSHCRYFPQLLAVAYQAYNQAVAHEAGLRRGMEQLSFMNRQLCGLSAMLSLLSGRLKEPPREAEEGEGALFSFLLRRGLTPRALDISYPDGQLCLELELPNGEKQQLKALKAAVEKGLRRPMRVLSIESVNGGVRVQMEERRGLRARMACASLPEDEQQVSGDETGELRMASGRVVFAVSDGMGSGEAAQRESRAAIGLLFDQFRLGVERELIYENVNRLLIARGAGEMYATLDAASIDLITGEAEMVKFGAPPTCLVRGGSVRLLFGEALPCGIVDEAKPSVRRIRLKAHDRLVFCTDGVYDLMGKELEGELKGLLTASPRSMAQGVLSAAMERGRPDDMTVMVVEVA